MKSALFSFVSRSAGDLEMENETNRDRLPAPAWPKTAQRETRFGRKSVPN